MARARTRPTTGRLVAWAVVAALALWTHYFALFVVAPEALLLLALRGVPLVRRLAGPGLVAVLASPLPALALTQRTRKYWFLGLPLPRRVNETGHLFLVGFRPPATSTAFAVAAAAVAVGLVLLAARADAAQRRGALVAAVVGGGAVGVPVALALAGRTTSTAATSSGRSSRSWWSSPRGSARGARAIVGVAATAAIVAVSFSVLDAAQRGPRRPAARLPAGRDGHRAGARQARDPARGQPDLGAPARPLLAADVVDAQARGAGDRGRRRPPRADGARLPRRDLVGRGLRRRRAPGA